MTKKQKLRVIWKDENGRRHEEQFKTEDEAKARTVQVCLAGYSVEHC